MKIVTGDIITVSGEIFSPSGRIIFYKDMKVKVSEVIIKGAFWGKMSGIYYSEEIIGLKIVGSDITWSLEMFKETSKNSKITREVLIEKLKKWSKANG